MTFEGAASGGDRGDGGLEGGGALERNVVWELAREVPIAADAPVTTPYWLRDAAGIGRYAVADRGLVGLPVGPPALLAEVRQRGLTVHPGLGSGDAGDWPPEESLLVLGLDEAAAVALGHRFGQRAIVVGTRGTAARLVWIDPPLP